MELTRLRSAGLNLFQPGQRLLYLDPLDTDFTSWETAAQSDLRGERLQSWLSTLRGLPLSGLEDLGSPDFQEWLQQQRWHLEERIAYTAQQVITRLRRSDHLQEAEMVEYRLRSIGLESSPELPQAELPLELHFERPELAEVSEQVLALASKRPHVLLLSGPPGSGKHYELQRLIERGSFMAVEGSSSSLRLTLARVVQVLLPQVLDDIARALRQTLLYPQRLEEDATRVAYALAESRRPLLLYFDAAHEAEPELAQFLLLALSGRSPLLVVLLARSDLPRGPLLRNLWQGLQPYQRHEVVLGEISLTSLTRTLMETQPDLSPAQRGRLAEQLLLLSEGNPYYLRLLLARGEPNPRLPSELRDRWLSESERWPLAERRALARLSLIHGGFDEHLATGLVGDEARTVLDFAFEHRIIREYKTLVTVSWPDLTEWPADPPAPGRYVFSNEPLRITLAGQVPAPERYAVHKRLTDLLADRDPVRAAYYAASTGQEQRAAELRERSLCPVSELWVPPLDPPVGIPEWTPAVSALGSFLDYRLSLEGGRLRIRRRGLYGPAETLRLRFTLPPGEDGPLRLIWRLDFFHTSPEFGDVESRPLAVSFDDEEPRGLLSAARLRSSEWVSEHWMRHELRPLRGGRPHKVELSLRCLDISICIAGLSWGTANLLLPAAAGTVAPRFLPG
ncbi:hypothetical protein HNR42_003341 [Deinobacterium chartae]|uniref:Uncharacterized protein n=1 Tax=Deinobacterium chartae TaxID=521158 RepID=A0A841I232_9DEIO|nr:ATP-binding protein [Deinobacterium chartae]MBB6099881.1 hypothetical protein [Deinobacterium chartae]